jgi:hypothetical protein
MLDRDDHYKNTPMYKEMIASRNALESLNDRIAGLNVPARPGIHFPPGNLSELIDVLQVATGPNVADVSEALRQELESRGYFNLFVEVFAPLRIAVQSCHAKHLAGVLTAQERQEFLESRQVARMENARDRHRQNAATCLAIYAQTNQQLWLDFATMHQLNADGLNELMDLSSEIE